MFGPGTNILGYSNYKVDKDVISAIKNVIFQHSTHTKNIY